MNSSSRCSEPEATLRNRRLTRARTALSQLLEYTTAVAAIRCGLCQSSCWRARMSNCSSISTTGIASTCAAF